MEARIRTFETTDRSDVRRIARSTAEGYPNPDTAMVADLLTNYYVKYEPEHLLVVERGEDLVGYLSGCYDTGRCRRIKATRVMPKAFLKSFFRGEVGLREIRYLGSFLYVASRGGTRNNPPEGYPAHFHINLEEGARGAGIGTRLVERFLEGLREAGIPGVHVRIRQNDRRASGFFRSLGFSREYGYPTLVVDDGKFRTSRSVIYTRELRSG